MDITDFVASRRADALLVGDYSSYRAQLTRKLHTLRKRLGRTTPKNKKYVAHARVTAEDVGKNSDFVYLLLILSERAWATAMHMKSVHSTDPSAKGIAGSTRRHIISRLNKAVTYARQLVESLQDRETSHASLTDLLEARAYMASLLGAFWMEKGRWSDCLVQYSMARVIYAALEKRASRQTLRDILSSTVDPSIRYAAYQLKLPRSTPLPSIAVNYFPAESEARREVEIVDAECLKEPESEDRMEVDGTSENRTISWRSRTVPIEDASIAQALGATSAAEAQLTTWLSSSEGRSSTAKDIAANYDNVIIASQDAVDATKTAIDEFLGEGVDQSDKRMQALQVTRTAVNYALVGWRVGRNRVLCGVADGLDLESGKPSKSGGRHSRLTGEEHNTGRRLTQLREQVVLYDAILQSLDSIKELPGVAGDASFMRELEGKCSYFQSLRCLAIARSHATLSSAKNALALFARAQELVQAASKLVDKVPAADPTKPLQLDITGEQLDVLSSRLQGYVWQYQGIVEIENAFSEAAKQKPAIEVPLIERLDTHPDGDCDLSNLVPYPPRVQPIPVKPLFFDIAWNYIDYPREDKKALEFSQEVATEAPAPEAKETKRGWFGFGRR
ncbi:hypothetical protein VTO42DRAFT_6023 [Malbranchea cinnamomea]